MPTFELDHGTQEAAARFRELDTFTQAYVEAMFWTDANTDDGDLEGASFDELSPSALTDIIEDCRDFQEANAADLAEAYNTGSYDESGAGHDFWLTRNRHGAGFWDRGLGEIGDKLTKNAHPYGSCYLYRGDDKLIYVE